MYYLDVIAVLIVTITVIAVINSRVFKMPPTIGVTVGGLMVSLLVSLLAAADFGPAVTAAQTMSSIAFDRVVFVGVLSFLLFAGALFLDSHELWRMATPVSVFALLSTFISTALIGLGAYGMFRLIGHPLPLVYCLLFGALISPTDPVAVLGMLKHARVPARIETLIAGESLFNDGIGVVLFTVLAAVATGSGGHGSLGIGEVAVLFLRDALGGLLLGAVIGAAGLVLMRIADDYVIDVLISLAVVVGLTALAIKIEVSAPLAAVAAGLVVGSLTDRAISPLSNPQYFEGFWHLIDELLNLFLFALLAFNLVVVHLDRISAIAAPGAIVIALIARAISIGIPAAVLEQRYHFEPYTRRLMIWGGLRGALAVALVFTLPDDATRQLFLGMTYAVVVFSLVIQGLTMNPLATKASQAAAAADAAAMGAVAGGGPGDSAPG